MTKFVNYVRLLSLHLWNLLGYSFETEDDHFTYLRKVTFDLGNYNIVKSLNGFCLGYHIVVLIMQFYYIDKYFTLQLITRYSAMTIVTTYMIITIMCTAILNKSFFGITQKLNWDAYYPDSELFKESKEMLRRRFKKWDGFLCFVFSLTVFVVVTNLTVWGDQGDLFICVRVFDSLLKDWSTAAVNVYFYTLPFLTFSAGVPALMLIYVAMHIQAQFFHLGQNILQIFRHLGTSYGDETFFDGTYQLELKRRLCWSIKRHVLLKRMYQKFLECACSWMPVFLFLGILSTISLSFLLLYHFRSLSSIMMVRLFSFYLGGFTIWVGFCTAGQKIIDESESLFEVLRISSWDVLNVENRLILLTFMVNCRRSLSLECAGITLNLNLLTTAIRVTTSYASVLYQFDESRWY